MGDTYTGAYGTDYIVQTSSDLTTWTPATVAVGAVIVDVTPGKSVILHPHRLRQTLRPPARQPELIRMKSRTNPSIHDSKPFPDPRACHHIRRGRCSHHRSRRNPLLGWKRHRKPLAILRPQALAAQAPGNLPPTPRLTGGMEPPTNSGMPQVARMYADFRGASTYTVTLAGNVSATKLNFTSGNAVTLTGNTIDLGSTGVIDFNGSNAHQLTSLLKGAITFNTTGSLANLGSTPGCTINQRQHAAHIHRGESQSGRQPLRPQSCGGLGCRRADVKITKGVINLGNVAATAISYNAWDLELNGGALRGRFNIQAINGPVTVTANSTLMTRDSNDVQAMPPRIQSWCSPARRPLPSELTPSSSMPPAADNSGIELNGVISGTGGLTQANQHPRRSRRFERHHHPQGQQHLYRRHPRQQRHPRPFQHRRPQVRHRRGQREQQDLRHRSRHRHPRRPLHLRPHQRQHHDRRQLEHRGRRQPHRILRLQLHHRRQLQAGGGGGLWTARHRPNYQSVRQPPASSASSPSPPPPSSAASACSPSCRRRRA